MSLCGCPLCDPYSALFGCYGVRTCHLPMRVTERGAEAWAPDPNPSATGLLDSIGWFAKPTRADAYPNNLPGKKTMTTTPDSRIRADWTLPAATASPPPTVTPDTSTTAGRIAVMQAFVDGQSVQVQRCDEGEHEWHTLHAPPDWNWAHFDYRIAPPPPARTALQRARDCRAGMTVVNSESPDGILCCLLTDLDYAPIVEVLERRISWDAADLSALPKGRYRLLRDDV